MKACNPHTTSALSLSVPRSDCVALPRSLTHTRSLTPLSHTFSLPPSLSLPLYLPTYHSPPLLPPTSRYPAGNKKIHVHYPKEDVEQMISDLERGLEQTMEQLPAGEKLSQVSIVK